MTNTNTNTNTSTSTLQDQQQLQPPKQSYFEKEHNDNDIDNDKYQYNFYSSCGANKDIKDIFNLRYEDLRKKGLKMELEIEEKNTNSNSNSNSNSNTPGSQELYIFIQRGMIEWVEVWNKYQSQYPLNELNEMNNRKKIKALVYNDNDRKLHTDTDTDTDTDTSCDYAGINLPLNLQAQVKNLLVQILMSTLPNKMSAKPITLR